MNAIEIMPVAEFPGARGWGYDGVYISAAQSSYGGPEGLRELVAAAHDAGLAVILDVVYNHVGASGVTGARGLRPVLHREVRDAVGPRDQLRRRRLRRGARVGAAERVRLDRATSGSTGCGSTPSTRSSIPRRSTSWPRSRGGCTRCAPTRWSSPSRASTTPRSCGRRRRGGFGCDAAWADDFHHSVRTLVTDEREGYYAEFGRVADLAKCLHRPFVHDGTWSSFRGRRFGAPADDVQPERFVVFDQNHDQVGNRAFGDRLPADARPLAAFCTLLSPFVPMLFMGEEYGETAPFQFFSDHIDPEIADATRDGRRAEFAAFASFAEEIPDPQAEQTFLRLEAHSARRTRRPPRCTARCSRCGGELRGQEATEIDFDEDARWLRFRRGAHTMVCNFSATEPLRAAGGAPRPWC